MACFAEIHFPYIRQTLLKSINRAYGRVKDCPKDLTVDAVNKILRFDTDEEVIEFVQEHDMEFSSDGADEPYLVVDRKARLGSPTLRHPHSVQLVERKRNDRPLPQVIHTTVFEEASPTRTRTESPEGMFVSQSSSSSAGKQAPQQNITESPALFSPPVTSITSTPPVESASKQAMNSPFPGASLFQDKQKAPAPATIQSPFLTTKEISPAAKLVPKMPSLYQPQLCSPLKDNKQKFQRHHYSPSCQRHRRMIHKVLRPRTFGLTGSKSVTPKMMSQPLFSLLPSQRNSRVLLFLRTRPRLPLKQSQSRRLCVYHLPLSSLR